jgi:hypothetical protein
MKFALPSAYCVDDPIKFGDEILATFDTVAPFLLVEKIDNLRLSLRLNPRCGAETDIIDIELGNEPSAVSGRGPAPKLPSNRSVERRLILLAVERAGSRFSEKSSLISSRACETRWRSLGFS